MQYRSAAHSRQGSLDHVGCGYVVWVLGLRLSGFQKGETPVLVAVLSMMDLGG